MNTTASSEPCSPYFRSRSSSSFAAASPTTLRSIAMAAGYQLDVVHRRAGVAVLALDDVGDRGAREHRAGGLGRLGEDRFRARAQLAVEHLDDLQHGDLGRLARERVAALHAALGAQDPAAPQHRE